MILFGIWPDIKSGILSGILSDTYFDNLFDVLFDILYILFGSLWFFECSVGFGSGATHSAGNLAKDLVPRAPQSFQTRYRVRVELA